ncbi:phospholipid-binding protein MlaC [Ferrigenium sp. UT5]|uniref:MlaC/ttg2D family ABC transporter substrate-binding protein n=1 Tax=Ferrigenium sp. UT5 TaxID=3242105 RepID=UPI0035506578
MKSILVFLLAGLLSLPVFAQRDESTPDGLIMSTVDQVLEIVRKDKTIVTDQQRMYALVEDLILPHFDFARMTQLAVGRPWRGASPEQKAALVREFRNMLVRTYTITFSNYVEPKIEFKSLRTLSNDEATVLTEIQISDGRIVTVNYELRKTAVAGWQVFDIVVEGISLVTSYRNTFADQIQREGIDGLIRSLADKNQISSVAATPAPVKSN